MAGEIPDEGEALAGIWPLPNFYFSVVLGDDDRASFQEVEGLEAETQVIEYRHGNSKRLHPIKMPGLGRVGNVTLKKGVFAGDSGLWDWYSEIMMNTIARRTVVISLLDQTGFPKMVWTLSDAWPTKIAAGDLRPAGNEVAIESLELAYESLTVAAP